MMLNNIKVEPRDKTPISEYLPQHNDEKLIEELRSLVRIPPDLFEYIYATHNQITCTNS
jgi:hypothetical protein